MNVLRYYADLYSPEAMRELISPFLAPWQKETTIPEARRPRSPRTSRRHRLFRRRRWQAGFRLLARKFCRVVA